VGEGNPSLCDEHADLLNDPDVIDPAIIVDAAVARMAEIPQVKKILGKFGSLLDQFGGAFARGPSREYEYEEVEHEAPPPPRARRAPPPPPRRPAPPPPRRDDPRVVLGIEKGAAVTKELIKARYRALAAIYHPDKGGNTEMMQRLTSARDALLKTL
jgi:hypothetical protein